MEGICPICKSPVIESQFCKRHHRAHLELQNAFHIWQVAYGNELTKKDFLERLLKLPETGQAAREVSSYLLEKGSI